MTPLCDSNTGVTVGWAVANASCEGGTITITYIDALTNETHSSKPASWEYCRPAFSGGVIYNIVQLTQAAYDALVTKDPNTLYVIVE